MFFKSVLQRRSARLVVLATGLLFLTLLQGQLLLRSFVHNPTVEKNEAEVLRIKGSSPNETRSNALSTGENSTLPLIIVPSVLPDDDFNTNQTIEIEIDSAHPLFFKDGLQRVCSKGEDQDSIMEMQSSSRPPDHTFKCLTVSEDGTSVIFTALNLSSLSIMMESGEAVLFGAGIDQQTRNEAWFLGRLMNRLIQLRNALSHTAFCGKLIIVPRTLSNDDPESRGEFDCADFRRMGNPKTVTTLTSSTTATGSDELRGLLQPNNTKTVNSCSLLFPNDKEYWYYYDTAKFCFVWDFKKRFDAAHRIFLAWWGLGPGYFRCSTCSESDRNLTIAWLRSGDVFRKKRKQPLYGQPPLEYYILSIKHSQARNVLLLSQNGLGSAKWTDSNPLVSALSEFDFGNQTDSGSDIHLSMVLGEPFQKVLHQLFCARVAIIGVSTLSAILTFSPNAHTIYLAKPWIYSQALEYGTADIYFYDVGLSRSQGLEFENNTFNNNVGVTNYSVYRNWRNSPRQRQEMLLYQGGTLKPLLLQNSRSRHMA